MTDVPSFEDIAPTQSVGEILVDVKPLSDPPSIFMFSPDGLYMLEADPTIPVVVSDMYTK